jgi:hypothetical protein
MRTRRWQLYLGTLLLAWIAFLGNIPGCGMCSSERVTAHFPAQWVVNGNARTIELADYIGESFNTYGIIRATVQNAAGAGAAPGGIVWSVGTSMNDGETWLFLGLDTPVGSGESIPVRTIHAAGPWSMVYQPYFPTGERAVADLQIGSFRSAAVTGTLQIVDASPLTVATDLTFRNAAADTTVRVVGTMSLRVETVKEPCD